MSSPRRGLVLGAGGVLGAAWTIGALCALEEETDINTTKVDVLVGTSAGSVVAALLAAGVSPEEQRAHQLGENLDGSVLDGVELDYDALGGRPPTPWPGVGSARLLAAIVRDRRLLSAPLVLAGLLPRGRGSVDTLVNLIDQIVPRWPKHPEFFAVALDYHAGKRVALGRKNGSSIRPSQAVAASCAIPGWFTPVEIEGRVYVDGGTASIASADLAAGRDLDEVYVFAPLAWLASPESMGPSLWMLQHWRRALTRQLSREVDVLRAEGTKVTVIAPTAEDLLALGTNPMDQHRRLEVLETSLRTSRASFRGMRRRRVRQGVRQGVRHGGRAVQGHRDVRHHADVSHARRRGRSS
jgi:NTE family protein